MKESILFPGFFTRDDDSDKPKKVKTVIPDGKIQVPLIGVGDDLRDLSSFTAVLGNLLTKPRLILFCTRIINLVNKGALCFTGLSGEPLSRREVERKVAFSFSATLSGISKERMLRLLVPVVYDTHVFLDFLDTYGEQARKKWLDLLDGYMLPGSSFGNLCVNGLFNTRYYYGRPQVKDKDTPMNLLVGVREDYGQTYVKVPAELARHQLKALYPEILSGNPLDDLPSKMDIFSGGDILSLLPSLTMICQTDQIKFTQKGNITQANLKRIASTISMNQMMPPANSMYKESNWRLSILLMSLYRMLIHKKLHDSEDVLLRYVAGNLPEMCAECDMQVLPHLKGYNIFEYRIPFRDRVRRVIQERFSRIRPGKWYDVRELALKLRMSEVDKELGMEMLVCGGNYTVNGCYASQNDFFGQVALPYLKGHLAMLAAYGIVDIATAPEDGRTLEGDFYYRVTPVGAFALGLTEKLERPDADDSPCFAIDSANRIIRNLREANPMLSLLKEVAVATAADVYEVTPESFLSQCVDGADMRLKIKRFSAHVLGGQAGEWEDFFKTLESRVERVHKADSGNYVLLDIDPAATKVMELIDTDPQVRANTLKVEGYRLLVAPAFYTKLLRLLRSIGYIPASIQDDTVSYY